MFKRIEISHRTIIFTTLFLLGLWFLFFVRGIILELFVAFLLVTILEPLVAFLTKIKIPRAISVLITYILVIGILGGVIVLIAPTLAQQTTNFMNALPGYLSKIGINSFIGGDITNGILGQLGGLSGEVLNFTFSLFSNFLGLLTVLVFAFYILLGHSDLKNQIELLFGEGRGLRINKIVIMIEEKLGKWARGQLILMLAIATGMYLGLLLIGIPFALPLAILSGLFEIIPFLGPIVSAVPAVIIGFGMSPLIGVAVLVFAFFIHQLENYILVPKIMEKSVGVSPLLILVSITIGAKLAGLMGVIVAIPFVIMLQVLIKEYFVKE